MRETDPRHWAVSWRQTGETGKQLRTIADMPDEFSARQFAQICALLTTVSDVHVLPPVAGVFTPPVDRGADLRL